MRRVTGRVYDSRERAYTCAPLVDRGKPSHESQRMYRFGGFSFNPDTGELVGASGVTRLQPQPAQVLALLVSRAGELVTREQIRQTLWPDTVVEADQGINYCIRQVRAALGDDADGGRFIETLPRRGYRLVATLEAAEHETPSVSSAAEGTPSGGQGTAVREGNTPVSRRPWLGLVVAVAAAIGVVGWIGLSADGRAAGGSRAVRIAVLPLETPSGDASLRQRNAQITERLVVELTAADSGRFGIVGPATTARVSGDARPHTEIGEELGVAYVLSGGIRPTDSTLFVQLIRARDGEHVFAFRRPIAGVPDETLAADVLRSMRERLGSRLVEEALR